jgi:hypothetical protein
MSALGAEHRARDDAEPRPRRRPGARLGSVYAAALIVLFTGAFPFLYGLNNPNENVRTYMTMAIVDAHTFRIDDLIARYGWTNDMAKAPDKDGVSHLYSVKAPATSYLGVPVYAAFRAIAPRFGLPQPGPDDPTAAHKRWFVAVTWALRVFTIQIPCVAFLLLFERWLRRVSQDDVLRWATVFAAGLGTNYLAYAMLFASHAPFAWASFASFALVFAPRRRALAGDRVPFLAGVFAGLVTLFEYHGLPVSAALGILAVWRFRRWRPLVAFATGAATQALALMFFQWRAYGNPLTPGHKMCENPQFAAVLSQGLFGIGTPDPKVFWDLTVSPAFGFFGTSPFMWIGLAAIPLALTARRSGSAPHRGAVLAAAFVMFVLWLTVSAAVNWRGGWTIGPRYLGAAPPFFGFLALVALERAAEIGPWARTFARAAASGLALASVLSIGLAGMLVSSLPEDVTRPLVEVVGPFVIAGLVPHHVGELVGVQGPAVFYALVALLLLAPLSLAFVPAAERPLHRLARPALAAAFFVLGMRPALSKPDQSESLTAGANTRAHFLSIWEPTGHDRLSSLRRRHAEKTATACDYAKLARMERLLKDDDAAARFSAEEARLGGCASLLQRF